MAKTTYAKYTETQKWLAVDQHGQTVMFQGAHPRKALMDKMDASHTEKMYRDYKDGSTHHEGWIIQGRWFSVYRVENLA